METAVESRLVSLRLGEAQIYKNIAIVPLIAPADGALPYLTLGEALATPDFAITEISDTGSVPDLLVINRGGAPVLVVDGEELAGAKQNRVVNASILIKERSETKIPVSCTEQGRWAYSSENFSESGHIMTHKSRVKKSRSVLLSLESSGQHYSDQHEVWHEIAGLHAKAGSHSPTSAMSDVYRAREEDLRQCDEVFKPVPNQVGLLAFIGGIPVGVDFVSLTTAYAKLHLKLVRSYTLEALLVGPKPGEGGLDSSLSPNCGAGWGEGYPDFPYSALARTFLDDITTAEERQFPSIGHGTDFRYRLVAMKSNQGGSAASTICGSALVHANEVIHAAFFRLDDPSALNHEPSTTLAALRQRRRHFTRRHR